MYVTINVDGIEMERRRGLYQLGILDVMEGECQVPEDMAQDLLRPRTPEVMESSGKKSIEK